MPINLLRTLCELFGWSVLYSRIVAYPFMFYLIRLALGHAKKAIFSWEKRSVRVRQRQEIQEMLRRLSAWESWLSHADAPHTAGYPSVPSELNLRRIARQEGDDGDVLCPVSG